MMCSHHGLRLSAQMVKHNEFRMLKVSEGLKWRRLVLVGGGQDHPDTESVGFSEEGLEVSGEVVQSPPSPTVDVMDPIAGAVRGAFRLLDGVVLAHHFARRPSAMKSVPRFLRGPFRTALRIALTEVSEGIDRGDVTRQERGWKLLLLFPRMLLHRPPRGGLISKEKLGKRLDMFARGEWIELLTASALCYEEASVASRRRQRRHVVNKTSNAEQHVPRCLGEISAGRHALEGADLAPANQATLTSLTDHTKRPLRAREAIPEGLMEQEVFSESSISKARGRARPFRDDE